ncbi:MAG: hypothetical protein DBX59_06395 [Bacillota bacterium]|nr:MAG: hypothetical protein DBX59_06395 [Bacillota bacterium]
MKKKKNIWVKKRHARVYAFLRVALAPIMRIKYRYKPIKSDLPKGPYLILSNHQASMDPFWVSKSFRFQIYFFASDDIFNLKVSPIIEYLVAPIPKSKSLTDLQAVKDALRVLREGGAVGVFPEGNRTLSGGQWEMGDSIAKLVKVSKVPLVLYNLCGGYGTDPRWGGKIRRGTKYVGFVKRVVQPEEYAAMSVEELFALIKKELDVNDALSGERYKSRRRAEYIERALYLCPECGGVSTFVSHKTHFRCAECGTSAEYTEDMKISPPIAGYRRILEWFEWEKKEIAARVLAGERVSDEGVLFRESIKFKRKKKLDGSGVAIDKDNLYVTGGAAEQVYPLKDIVALTMVGKKKFNFYYGNRILQIKGDKRFCAVKYAHIFDGLNAERNKNDIKE